MKRLLVIALAILSVTGAPVSAEVKLVNGKFVLVEDESTKSVKEPDLRIPDYPVKDKKTGKIRYYPCYISKNGKGSAYIIRPKVKNPNETYRVYLGKEETAKLKKQLNIQE